MSNILVWSGVYETCFISVWEPAYFQLWIIYGLGDSSCNHLDGTAGQKGGKSPEFVFDSVLIGVLSGIIEARLFFVFLYDPGYYLSNPLQILNLQQGGLAFYGGFVFGLATILIYLYRAHIPVLSFLDLAAPATALGYAIARFGCFMNGCCYGKPTTVAWGVVFPVIDGLKRHPTQLYSVIAGFLIFILLVWITRRGFVFGGRLFAFF